MPTLILCQPPNKMEQSHSNSMDEVAFQDWPGSPIDLNNGNNPWTPAYGFPTPNTLLEKEDFIGNPDAEYFLNGSVSQYLYLETIQEETSDDLRSESDVSRNSPVGWLATDSEDGSIVYAGTIDEAECDSDRELACPPKRRKQDFLSIHQDEDSPISRSSSLVAFENLEKQCQEVTQASKPSQFSFDSLEVQKTPNHDFSPDYDGDFFRNFENEINRNRKSVSRDSLLYNASTRYSSSESSDSDTTVENSRSCDNLKTWRSFDSLHLTSSSTKKFSSENLSEDSGYGDQLLTSLTKSLNFGHHLSGSTGNLDKKEANSIRKNPEEMRGVKKKNSYVGFGAYDCEVVQTFTGNFGVSYQDLSSFERFDPFGEPLSKSSPLTDVFLRRKHARQLLSANSSMATTQAINLNINLDTENYSAKFRDVPHAASVPNLLQNERSSVDIQEPVVGVYSVPKDLNFIGDLITPTTTSVAEKNWNLADLSEDFGDLVFKPIVDDDDLLTGAEELEDMANYKREGSYSEAMTNRVDLSDDEGSLRNKKKLPKSPIVDFDRRVLKAISEQSLQSLVNSTLSLNGSQNNLNQPRPAFTTFKPPTQNQNAISTPNLNRIEPVVKREHLSYFDDDRRKSTQEISSSRFDTSQIEEERGKNILLTDSNDESDLGLLRKNSIMKSSTSTSGMSDIDDKTLRHSVKSFSGSNSSKGVHFSPVVAEVNWRDDVSTSTVTPDRDSLYSLNSSSPEPRRRSPKLVKPKPQYPPSHSSRRSVSQPDLSDVETKLFKREFIDSLKGLRSQDMSKSQPDVSKLRRRGSKLVKKDRDGRTIQAYVDLDGVQYQHTHLDMNSLSQNSLHDSNSAMGPKLPHNPPKSPPASKSTNKYPFPQLPPNRGGAHAAAATTGLQSSGGAMADRTAAPVGNDADTRKKSKSGLGGFLQRLASFRLGAKKGHEKKEQLKRKQGSGNGTTAGQTATAINTAPSKPDYIYIPLKGPSPLNNNNQPNPVASKPPLPKQPPPRVVHASVKKNAQAPQADERRRRRTIDSTGADFLVSTSSSSGRHHHAGNVSMDGPMGLIETDLDTEVTVITNGANAKARSLLDLGEPRLQIPHNTDGPQNGSGRPHKSMEFLLDKENLKVVEPPENELQKTERVMSEHELRVQRSLQKLTVPDWYKNSQIPAQGFLLKKTRESRWTGTGSKTTSLSSLGSGTQSPLILSPTPSSQPFVRWSTSKLNSTASSPCQSTRSSFNQGRQPNGTISPSSARSSFSYRQPYMGWRSQERLNRPRTTAERLASSLLNQQANLQQESPEIQTSIKEVTSAIVHYVSGLKPTVDGVDFDSHSRRSSSVSPRGSQKLCWLESSFVGTKPLDSPETPVTCSESPVPPPSLRLELQNHSNNETVSASTSPQRRSSDVESNGVYRRRSEGCEPATVAPVKNGDQTLPTPVLLRCRYSRCGKTALPSSKEAKSYKNCHNCSYTYCSRACRRSHWERHRKTCLFSRMGTLCRQVIQAVRDQKDTLRELSTVAKRGYISHGLGAVKCFYPNPEGAEKFLANGLQSLGELTYVRWQDLLPTEMGPLLYKELVEMCQNYNPESKFVLYISLCVVSETPASGAVKWERQLVSRCAKLRLSKDINLVGPERDWEASETLILTCPPIRLPTKETSKRARLIAFNNLQSQLSERGVSLKKQYPDLFQKLDSYCEDLAIKVEPETIFPHSVTTHKSFVCIVMLESDQEKVKLAEKSGGSRVRTVDCLLSCETTTTQ